MTILHVEPYGSFTLTVSQPYAGSGLEWRIRGAYFNRTSAGRFYLDHHDEVIHGATLAEVVATAVASAKSSVPLHTERVENKETLR